jgi:hypothetical protein
MLRKSARQVLAELELCSVTRAHAHAPLVSGAHAGSRPPTGGASPAEHWRARFESAHPGELAMLERLARDELESIRRRRFPTTAVRNGDDLRERIVSEGEGSPARDVAIALRTSEGIVRRTRLTDGRDAERGRELELRRHAAPDELVAAGMSVRAAAAATGVPRSTLAGRLARAANAN